MPFITDLLPLLVGVGASCFRTALLLGMAATDRRDNFLALPLTALVVELSVTAMDLLTIKNHFPILKRLLLDIVSEES